MRGFDECLELTRKIKEKEELICELKARVFTPRNQVISDMPRGGGGENEIEKYIIKLEKLETLVKRLKDKRNDKWHLIIVSMSNCGIMEKETVNLLHLRFYNGLSWEVCSKRMHGLYPDGKWNLNKCFRVYRSVLYKLNKAKS